MKRYILVIILLIIYTLKLISQTTGKEKLYPNEIEYAIITNENYLFPMFQQNGSIYPIMCYNYKQNPLATKKTGLPLSNWDYHIDTMLYINPTGDLFYQEIIGKEHIERIENTESLREGIWKNLTKFSVIPYKTYQQSFLHKEYASIINFEKMKEKINTFIDFDIKIKDPQNATIYMKDHQMFLIFNVSLADSCYTYPTVFWKEVDPEILYTCWNKGIYYYTHQEENNSYPHFLTSEQEKDYSNKLIRKILQEKPYAPFRFIEKHLETPSSPQGYICDNDFFKGNFKVIYQKENTYVFNLHNGRIYIMTPQKVKCIGTISLENYTTPFKKRKYLIENRDNDEIILFGSVDWRESDHPKPQIKIMTKQEFDEWTEHIHFYSNSH